MTERSEEMLEACIPQEDPEDRTPIILRNNNKKNKSFNAKAANWRIKNPFFSATVRVDPPDIPSQGGVRVF